MSKLIGHYYDGKNPGTFSLFKVAGLKETNKQYKRVKESTEIPKLNAYSDNREYWSVLPKSEIDTLRNPGGGNYIMYSHEADMPRFKWLVISALERIEEREKRNYDRAVAALVAAKYAADKKTIIFGDESVPYGKEQYDAAAALLEKKQNSSKGGKKL